MIHSFEVKNFRLFNNIQIRHLKNVNLIVGKNNAGKSALLESLLLYFSRISSDVLLEILYARQEHWEPGKYHFGKRQSISPLKHLFKNHKIPDLHDKGFSLSSRTIDDEIYVRAAAYILEESEDRMIRREVELPDIDESDLDLYELYLVAEINGSSSIIVSLQDDIDSFRRRRSISLRRKAQKNSLPYQFVPTQGIHDSKASALWDGISLTNLEKEVIKGLQLVEPNVVDIAFVQNSEAPNSRDRIPLIKIKELEEPVPLKSLGDGMARIFQIILSLVSARDGILLIDEFENGLHWSVQEEVWKIVFELALKLDVQVFATTHSRDCITGFEKAWIINEANGAFLRITKKNNIATIKEYDLELLSDSIETDVEVR